MTEADFEYLIRTLSDARSRATELTVAVRARAANDPRLSELGQSAVFNIEKLLREIRVLALDQHESAAPKPPAPPLPSDHWLQLFINDLVTCSRAPDAVSFEKVERMLQERKQVFLEELEIARRMYRVYPQMFQTRSRKASAS